MNGKNSRNGLGLAICKSWTTLLNGEINVSSIPNEVTTFTVTLPELSPATQETDIPRKEYETTPVSALTEPYDVRTDRHRFRYFQTHDYDH